METFMIETDAVLSSKGSIDSMASQVLNIANTVNGYDTSCEDGFNFAGAKSVIARNIEAAASKFQSTGKVMDSVVSQHTQLQNQLLFQDPAQQQSSQNSSQNGNQNGNYYGTQSSSSWTGSPVGSYSSYDDGSSTAVEDPIPTETITPIVVTEIKEKVKKVDTVKFDLSMLSTDLQSILSFNEAGLLVFEGMYVIACSAAFGKVGDIVDLVLKDGKKVRCFVGSQVANEGEIKFFVSDKFKAGGDGDVSKNVPDNVDKIYNYGTFTADKANALANPNTAGGVTPIATTPLGENTAKISTLSGDWVVPTVKTNITSYASYAAGKISQNANSALYGDKCLSFAETHAYALYTGNTSDSAASAANYPHGGAFTSWYSDSEQETLQKIYSEIAAGRPVVVQVNGNKQGTSRHFVTVVGFKDGITDVSQLTQKDLLIMDSWDGKLERMDQANSRFFTTGKDCGKTYSGYYLRVLKA